jgi:pimeloyl-ACP methyl ester carboxylesterase
VGRRLAATAILGIVSVVSACGSTAQSAQPSVLATGTPLASPSEALPAQIFSGSVNVTADRQVDVDCWGTGTPTILLEAGGTSSDLRDWPDTFVSALAEHNTVCRYSRAGGPGSDPVDGLLSYRVIIHDAFTLLDQLKAQYGVEGPYLLVGWSFGGSVVLAEALAHPERVAGVVILDTDFAVDFLSTCVASGRSRADCTAEFKGDEEAKAIEAEIAKRVRPLPGIPFHIVSAMVLPGCVVPAEGKVTYQSAGVVLSAATCEQLAAKIADKQHHDWQQVAPDLAQTRVQADHDNLVNEAKDQILQIIRALSASA